MTNTSGPVVRQMGIPGRPLLRALPPDLRLESRSETLAQAAVITTDDHRDGTGLVMSVAGCSHFSEGSNRISARFLEGSSFGTVDLSTYVFLSATGSSALQS
jgi:hypothetical protein